MSSSNDAGELLTDVRRLAERFPLPHPIWHRFVAEMHVVIRDLFVALDVIAVLPRAQAELVRQVEGEAHRPLADAGGPSVAAARGRLRGLPVPEGEHPYLDEILVTLEAAEAVLAALAVADGEATFARRLQEACSPSTSGALSSTRSSGTPCNHKA